MIERNELEIICDAIETRLAQLGLPVAASGGKIYPEAGFIELIIEPSLVKGKSPRIDAILGAQPDIANAVKNNNVRVYQDSHAQITVEIQITQAKVPNIQELISQIQRKYELILGKDRIGNTLKFDLNSSVNAHLLISGTTGSGKTALAHSIIIGACLTHTPEEIKVVVIDHNNSEADWFLPLISNHLAVKPPTNLTEAEALLSQIASKMFENKVNYKTLIYIDEMAGLCAESTEALKAIEVIAQQGRKYGIHLIACTQKPSAIAIGSLMKANMRRAVGKVASPEDSKVASGIAGVGAETLQGNGQFIFIDHELIRFQSALPENYGERRPPEASNINGALFDFSLDSKKAGITLEAIVRAMADLESKGRKLIRKNVLEALGYEQAGGAARKANELWDQALFNYNKSKSDIDSMPDVVTLLDVEIVP